MRKRLVLALLALLWAATAEAHKPSDSYLSLGPDGAGFVGQWDIALRDLDHAIGLDTDGDGSITWGEVRARHDAIGKYALSRFEVKGDGAPCNSRVTEQLIDRHSDGAYAVLRFGVECGAAPRVLTLRYGLFFDVDPQHRGLLQITAGEATRALLFTVGQPLQTVEVIPTGAWQCLRQFWRDGLWKIWTGIGHVLFLLLLLSPAVLRRGAGRWQVVTEFRQAFGGALKIVVAFSVAHSITLTLAALGVLHLPERWVASAIAASVVLAALNNAVPLFTDSRWVVGFVFGLLHGFALAAVLGDPSLPSASLPFALSGFNLGVETGQLLLVAAFLPIAFALRRSWLYQRLTLVGGSLVIAALAAVWVAYPGGVDIAVWG